MRKIMIGFAALMLTAAAAAAETPTTVDEGKQPPLSTQPTCLKETGSRIPRNHDNDCIAANGRAYDRDDLQRTGSVTVGEGLRNLDPSLTVRRR